MCIEIKTEIGQLRYFMLPQFADFQNEIHGLSILCKYGKYFVKVSSNVLISLHIALPCQTRCLEVKCPFKRTRTCNYYNKTCTIIALNRLVRGFVKMDLCKSEITHNISFL